MSSVPRNTSSTDPKLLKARLFIGNLPTEKVKREDLTDRFEQYGEVIGCSLLRGYGFVQFTSEDVAREAISGENGKSMQGAVMDVRMAAEGRKIAQQENEGVEPPPPREAPPREPPPREAPPRPKRRRSRSPHRSEWHDHPPPRAHGYYPEEQHPPHHYDRYYEGAPPPPQPHTRHHPSPPRHAGYRGDWDYGGRPRPPPAEKWEHEEYMKMRRPRSPRPPSPRPHWYQSPPPPHRSDWPRPLSPRQQESPRLETKFDMEIIVINKQQIDYANVVSRRVSDLGLKVATKVLPPTASLSQLLDNAAKQGLLYAVIITNQHEVHYSLTLTILYGRNPQEHKNMPLEDALGLINRDFSRYCQAVREGRIPRQQSKRPDIAAALSGGHMSIEQISSVIDNLQQQRNDLMKKQVVSLGGAGSIKQQQADLQAKIRSLLGSNAVMPPSSSSRPPPQSRQQSSRDYWGPY